jgi:hypothetical protein
MDWRRTRVDLENLKGGRGFQYGRLRVGVDSRGVSRIPLDASPLFVRRRPWFSFSSGGSWDWFVVDAVVESEDAGTLAPSGYDQAWLVMPSSVPSPSYQIAPNTVIVSPPRSGRHL